MEGLTHNQIADTSAVTINGSGQLDLGNYIDVIESLTLNGGSVVAGAGGLMVRSNVTANAASGPSVIVGALEFPSGGTHQVTATASARLEIPAVVIGQGTLNVSGPGEVWLGGTNRFSPGVAVIPGGNLIAGNPEALGPQVPSAYTRLVAGGHLTLDHVTISNQVLRVDMFSASTLSALGTCAWWGDVESWNYGDLIADIPAGSILTVGGQVTGAASVSEPTSTLVKEGAGILELAGDQANIFGPTTVREGTLRLNKTSGLNAVRFLTIGDGSGGAEADVVEWYADEQVPDSVAITVLSSGLLNLRGHAETFASLIGSGAVSLGSGSLTVSGGAFSGDIRGGRSGQEGGDIIKTGPGTLALNGSNSYWGLTYVQDGTLLVNGTIVNSDIVISPGATLGGSGTVQSISFIGPGGVLAPGALVGRLTAQGAVALTNGTFEVELNGPTAGTEYDQLVTELAPILSGLLRRSCNLSVITGFTPPVGGSFVIISNRSASAVSGTFSGKAEGAKFGVDGKLFQITYKGGSGNDVVLTRAATPAVTNFVATASGGQMQLLAQGVVGASYVLEAAPHLNAPIPWQPIGTNVANASDLVQFVDADLSLNAQRFYRIASQ